MYILAQQSENNYFLNIFGVYFLFKLFIKKKNFEEKGKKIWFILLTSNICEKKTRF